MKKSEIEAMAKKLVAEKAKGVTVDMVADEKDAKAEASKALNAKFFKAIANQDKTALREVSAEVEAEIKALGDGQNITTDADGGYLVPTTVASQIFDALKTLSPIRQYSTVLNLGGKTKINIGATKPTGYWVAEGAEITRSKVTFTQKELVLHKVAGLGGLSYEAINDTVSSPDLQSYLVSMFADAIAEKEVGAFVSGDGNGKPYGFRSADITPVAKTASDISFASLVSLKYALPQAYRDNAVFFMNATSIAKLVGLVDDNHRPIFIEGLAQGEPATLLGRPVVEVSEMPNNEIWYNYQKDYIIGDGGTIRVDFGTEGDDFKTDKISVRVINRVAGRPTMGNGFAKLTLSGVSA